VQATALISFTTGREILLDLIFKKSPNLFKNFLFGRVLPVRVHNVIVTVTRKMPPGVKPFSESQKRAAIELWRAEIPLKKIRGQLQMSERGLRNILAVAYAKNHPEDPIKKKSTNAGRPSKLSLGTLQKIKRHLKRNPSITGKGQKQLIPGLADVSIRSIQKACCDRLKLPSRKMVDKPLLTARMKNDQLEFARRYAHWGVNQWKKVMFSDGSHFQQSFDNHSFHCRRAIGSYKLDPKFTRKRVKHPPKIMAWGCFSWIGWTALESLEPKEMMNGVRYRQVLDDKLEHAMGIHGTTHFLQDGTPFHKSKLVTAWFREHPNIQLNKWPGNSPNLNPIENVWSWMKTQLKGSTQPIWRSCRR
jgi:DDE superfamily endonuclease